MVYLQKTFSSPWLLETNHWPKHWFQSKPDSSNPSLHLTFVWQKCLPLKGPYTSLSPCLRVPGLWSPLPQTTRPWLCRSRCQQRTGMAVVMESQPVPKLDMKPKNLWSFPRSGSPVPVCHSQVLIFQHCAPLCSLYMWGKKLATLTTVFAATVQTRNKQHMVRSTSSMKPWP